MNSLSTEDKPLEQTMDVSMEKEVVFSEEAATADAESEMKNELTVLGEQRSGTIQEPQQQQQQQQQQHNGKEEEVMLPTRGTAENWKMLVNKAMKLTHVEKSFRAFYDMVVRVAFVKENCSDHLKKLATSIDGGDTLGCYTAAEPIRTYLFTVYERVIMEVHVQLFNLSRLDHQADEASNSHSSSATRSHSEISADSEYKEDLKVLPQHLDSGGYGEIEHKEELTSFDICCPLIGDFDELHERHQITLQEFCGCLENCFKHGSIFDNKSKPDEKKCKENLCTLESLLAGEKNISSHDHPVLIPGPLVAKESFVQPYLLVILQMLGSAIDKVVKSHESSASSKIRSSPDDKTSVQKNCIVPSTQSRPAPIAADKSIAANSRFIFVLRDDDAVQIPVERTADQVLSHLGKQVDIAFNFAGIGIDARATGVVLTTAYVKIVQLRLEKTGTPDMKLIQLETKCMPLLSKESFEKWVNGCESKWKSIKSELYGDGTLKNGDSCSAAVPSGLVALWNLMTSSCSVLVSRSPLRSSELGEMVGYGEFSTVHCATKSQNYVIKISRNGVKAGLEREAAILTALQQQKTEPVFGISQLVESMELPITIGGIDIRLPALILKPRGISAEMHLARSDNKKEVLHAIGKDMRAALDFIHSRGYTHNDVSPKNILFNELRQQALLIDFGLATLNYSYTIRGFFGTPRYTHPAIFSKYPRVPWTAEPVYDKSSLAFSMAVLSNNGKHLWKSFQPFDMTTDEELPEHFTSWAKKRASISWACLKQAGFNHDWESWCLAGL